MFLVILLKAGKIPKLQSCVYEFFCVITHFYRDVVHVLENVMGENLGQKSFNKKTQTRKFLSFKINHMP